MYEIYEIYTNIGRRYTFNTYLLRITRFKVGIILQYEFDNNNGGV